MPAAADLVLDMRFLQNPHWQEGLRERDGRDAAVGAYIAGDAAYAEAVEPDRGAAHPARLATPPTETRLSRVAFGCTGGRHRSVHVAEHIAARLRAAGFSPSWSIATSPRRRATAIDEASAAGTGRDGFSR